jgi:hypothetical protein
MDQNQAHKVWLQAAELVKDRVISPTLYQALELGVGITLERDEFVLGFSNADLPMASVLKSSQNLALTEKCLSEVLGQKVRLKIVEGTTLADYENWKQLQAMHQATRVTASQRRERERRVELAWDEVAEKITRGYARLHLRQLAQIKGAFIQKAFEFINQAVNELGYDDKADEISQRSLSRVFEKLATCVEVPAALLAYEFFKLRQEGKLK